MLCTFRWRISPKAILMLMSPIDIVIICVMCQPEVHWFFQQKILLFYLLQIGTNKNIVWKHWCLLIANYSLSTDATTIVTGVQSLINKLWSFSWRAKLPWQQYILFKILLSKERFCRKLIKKVFRCHYKIPQI